MAKYSSAQKEIATFIKHIGGQGRIHGCIIDIDFYNHVFLNPLDGKITAYYATSMVDKKVYRNIASLLKFKCNKLFVNLEKMNKNEVLQILQKYNLDSQNIIIIGSAASALVRLME